MTPDSRRDLSGTKLHGYLIERLIGKGGMGEVYVAYEESLDRKVALKVLPEHLAEDESFSARFLREARSAAKLEHPGICPIYAGGEAQGTYFIAMQYVEGETLGEVLEDYGSLPIEQALLIVRRVADALGFAHSRGFVHRDIKPDNIMVDREGRVKIMDFGLARRTTLDTRMTQTGMYVGTPEYSSPEQCETLDLDGRTDIYSLGIVLYEMLSGTVPYKAETPYALFTKICTETPRPIQELNSKLPDNIAAIVDKMIAKDREERYQATDELVDDIDAALRTLDIDSTAETAALPVPGLASYTTEKIGERAEAVTKRAPYGYKRKRKLAPVLALLIAVAVIGLWLALALTSEKELPDDKTAVMPDTLPEDTTAPTTQPGQTDKPEQPGDVIADPIKQTVIDRLNPPREMTGPKEGLPVARLLVCDFVNRNDNPEIDWMRIGVADMFMTDLTQARFLQVVSREEFTRLLSQLEITREKAQQDLSIVVKEIRADLILKGGIVKIGPAIRIDVQLLDASTGKLLLGETAQEREENFLSAIDKLSISLRTSITEVVRRSFPEAPEEIFADSGDKTLEEQMFLADAGAAVRELRKSAELAPCKKEQDGNLAKEVERNQKGGWTATGAPSPSAAEEKESVGRRAKADSADRGKIGKLGDEADGEDAEGAAESPAAGKEEGTPGRTRADHAQEAMKRQTRGGGGGLSEKAKSKPGAPVKDPGTPEKARAFGEKELSDAEEPLAKKDETRALDEKLTADKAVELTPARRNLLAMQLYYRALGMLEKEPSSAEVLDAAAGHLQEALDHNPHFSLARGLLDDVRKRLEETGK